MIILNKNNPKKYPKGEVHFKYDSTSLSWFERDKLLGSRKFENWEAQNRSTQTR